jgi:hypothetical protein
MVLETVECRSNRAIAGLSLCPRLDSRSECMPLRMPRQAVDSCLSTRPSKARLQIDKRFSGLEFVEKRISSSCREPKPQGPCGPRRWSERPWPFVVPCRFRKELNLAGDWIARTSTKSSSTSRSFASGHLSGRTDCTARRSAGEETPPTVSQKTPKNECAVAPNAVTPNPSSRSQRRNAVAAMTTRTLFVALESSLWREASSSRLLSLSIPYLYDCTQDIVTAEYEHRFHSRFANIE